MPTRKPMPDQQCACATARQMARLLTQLYDVKLRDAGIEAPQFVLLTTLELAGTCSQVDLGERHGLDKTTVSRNIRLLVSKGWIASSRGRDGRKRLLSLTSAGRRMLAHAKPAWQETQAQLKSNMTAREWNTMFRTFGKLARAVQAVRSETERNVHKVQ